jgi:hypothetical protein
MAPKRRRLTAVGAGVRYCRYDPGLANRCRRCDGVRGVLRLFVSSGCSTCGIICDRVLENFLSLVLGNAPPDAVRFPGSQRVLEALHDDWALCAESFGLLCALAAFEPTFTVGVEEH